MPSGIRPDPAWRGSRRVGLRDRQMALAAFRVRDDVTFCTEVTPTDTTTAGAFVAEIAGKSPSGSAPESVNSSVWQIRSP